MKQTADEILVGLRQERQRLKASLEALDSEIAVFERVLGRFGKNQGSGSPAPHSTDPVINEHALSVLIANSFDKLPNQFNTEQVRNLIEAANPAVRHLERASLPKALKRMASGNGGIELVEAGVGRRPSTFKKLDK